MSFTSITRSPNSVCIYATFQREAKCDDKDFPVPKFDQDHLDNQQRTTYKNGYPSDQRQISCWGQSEQTCIKGQSPCGLAAYYNYSAVFTTLIWDYMNGKNAWDGYNDRNIDIKGMDDCLSFYHELKPNDSNGLSVVHLKRVKNEPVFDTSGANNRCGVNHTFEVTYGSGYLAKSVMQLGKDCVALPQRLPNATGLYFPYQWDMSIDTSEKNNSTNYVCMEMKCKYERSLTGICSYDTQEIIKVAIWARSLLSEKDIDQRLLTETLAETCKKNPAMRSEMAAFMVQTVCLLCVQCCYSSMFENYTANGYRMDVKCDDPFEVRQFLTEDAVPSIFKVFCDNSNVPDIITRDKVILVGKTLADLMPIPRVRQADKLIGTDEAYRYILSVAVSVEQCQLLLEGGKFHGDVLQSLLRAHFPEGDASLTENGTEKISEELELGDLIGQVGARFLRLSDAQTLLREDLIPVNSTLPPQAPAEGSFLAWYEMEVYVKSLSALMLSYTLSCLTTGDATWQRDTIFNPVQCRALATSKQASSDSGNGNGLMPVQCWDMFAKTENAAQNDQFMKGQDYCRFTYKAGVEAAVKSLLVQGSVDVNGTDICSCYYSNLGPFATKNDLKASRCFATACSYPIFLRGYELSNEACTPFCELVYEWIYTKDPARRGDLDNLDVLRFEQLCNAVIVKNRPKDVYSMKVFFAAVGVAVCAIVYVNPVKQIRFKNTVTLLICAVALLLPWLLAGESVCTEKEGFKIGKMSRCRSRLMGMPVFEEICDWEKKSCECETEGQPCGGSGVCGAENRCYNYNGGRNLLLDDSTHLHMMAVAFTLVACVFVIAIGVKLRKTQFKTKKKTFWCTFALLLSCALVIIILFLTLGSKRLRTLYVPDELLPLPDIKQISIGTPDFFHTIPIKAGSVTRVFELIKQFPFAEYPADFEAAGKRFQSCIELNDATDNEIYGFIQATGINADGYDTLWGFGEGGTPSFFVWVGTDVSVTSIASK